MHDFLNKVTSEGFVVTKWHYDKGRDKVELQLRKYMVHIEVSITMAIMMDIGTHDALLKRFQREFDSLLRSHPHA